TEDVVRVVDRLPCIEIEHVDVALRVHGGLKGQLVALRAPRHGHDLVHTRHAIVRRLSGIDVDERDGVRGAALHRYGYARAVRAPRDARREDAQALELRVVLTVHEFADDPPVRGIR